MTDNVYAPPKAALSAIAESGAACPFYVVSTRKFIILFFATMGMYQLFWHFKNWNRYRFSPGANASLWPVPRAIFAFLFAHALFRHVAAYRPENATEPWNAGGNAWQVAGLMVASILLERLAELAVVSVITGWGSLLILIPLALAYTPVQDQINARCGDPAGRGNDTLTGANIAWCVFGVLLWVLSLIGIFGTGLARNS